MAGSSLANVGSQPGNLVLNPTSGVLTLTPTWSTATACPVGFQGSAQLAEFSLAGTLLTRISPAVSNVSSPFNGTLEGSVGALLNFGGVSPTTPGTLEWAMGCWTGLGGTGSVVYVQSNFITVAAGGTTYTTGAGCGIGAPISTTTTLTAAPEFPPVGATVTLTATEVASDSTHPAGTIQFEAGSTNVNAPVAVDTSGVASTTTTFAAAGNENLSAVFTPTASGCSSYAGSTGSFTLTVGALLAAGTNPVPVNVTVPPTGALSVTVATGSVTLAPASPATTPDETATGTLNQVTVSDSRNTFPGWSVLGQESVFTGSGTSTIPANSLGWTPAVVGPLVGSAVIGGAVAPVGANTGSVGPGLGGAATIALAHPGNGFGANTFNAALLLDIPLSTPPGAYAGTLTITYIEAGS
jgi:hypothetical protein